MDVYFSTYQIKPLKSLNRLTDSTIKTGIYLKAENRNYEMADYFPHTVLGDQKIDSFLESFPDKSHPYHLSLVRQIRTPKTPLPNIKFLNHQLWHEGSEVNSPVIKYKIKHKDDQIPKDILNSNCRMRLDANGLFTENEIYKYLAQLEIEQILRIDYIEDPSWDTPWSEIPIPSARDFIDGFPFKTLIYKPNRNFLDVLPTSTVFSGYMGSSLGSLHVYRELVSRGDLTQYHGLLTPHLYENEPQLFKGNYTEGFLPDKKAVSLYLEEINDLSWSRLCSI